jgi:hypothetical protein
MRRPNLATILLAACLSLSVAAAQNSEATDADPDLDRVIEMLEQARAEIRAFREEGGKDEDPAHPGRRWAAKLWEVREDHPGTPAADRATTESLHLMLHADQVNEAIERAQALGDEDGAWPTLIGILFEAAKMREEFGFFLERAERLVATVEDPDKKASLRFQMAQAHWVEGDVDRADAVLAKLETDDAADSGWVQSAAAAREELEHPDVRIQSRTERRTRDLWQRPGLVLDALDIERGDKVADVGSGSGYFTFLVARKVGVTGKVYAVDIDEESLKKLSTRAEYHERHQVPVELVIEEAARAGLRLRSFTREFIGRAGGRRFYLVTFNKPDPS